MSGWRASKHAMMQQQNLDFCEIYLKYGSAIIPKRTVYPEMVHIQNPETPGIQK